MSNRNKIVDLFQSKGLLFPETEKEVEEFELYNPVNDISPIDWESPERILKRGLQKLQVIKITGDNSLNKEIEGLRMVARKGGEVPQHVIDKMKKNQHRKDDK